MASVSLRRRAFEIIEPGIRRDGLALLFERSSILIILASVTAAVWSTLPGLTPGLRHGLLISQLVFGLFFLAEYAGRLWTAPEHPVFGREERGVLSYALTPLMVLDAVSLVPFVLLLAMPDNLVPIIIFQVLRFFRLARYSPALATVGRVLANEWRPLMAAGLIGLGLLL